MELGEKPPHPTIVVDLTPLVPGGANGGAKGFVVELVRQLSKLAPDIQFILLTQAAAHEELADLEGSNLRRVVAVGRNLSSTRASRTVFNILPHLPARTADVAARLGVYVLSALKRRRVGFKIRDLKVDLLFCPFTAPTYFEAGVPVVSIIYDLQHQTYPEFFSHLEVVHRDKTFADACRRSNVLIAISEFTRRAAIAKAGLDPACIKTIHLNISPRFLQKDHSNTAFLEKIGLGSYRYLIYPANFWKHKNHEILLVAFEMARARGLASDVRLVCTGDPGVRGAWLERATREMKLEEHVLFPGYISDSELSVVLANSTGLIYPSLYEGFGLPLVEAMAAGVPVGCGNTTSMPEIAGNAAILFDPRIPNQVAQAMISLVHDQTLRTTLIEAGRTRAAQFSDPRGMALEYLGLFQQILGLNPRPPERTS